MSFNSTEQRWLSAENSRRSAFATDDWNLYSAIEGIPPPDKPCVDSHVEAPPKPCARRIAPVNGSRLIRWCLLPDNHEGDCAGATPNEIPVDDYGRYGEKRKWKWGMR